MLNILFKILFVIWVVIGFVNLFKFEFMMAFLSAVVAFSCTLCIFKGEEIDKGLKDNNDEEEEE